MSNKTFLIIILLIGVVSSGSFFMYNVFDGVKTKYDPTYYLTIKNNDDTKLADITVSSDDAYTINYLRDFNTKKIYFVLYYDNGLKVFDVKENKIIKLIDEKNYKKGEYFLHINSSNDVLGYFYKGGQELYYYDINSGEIKFNNTNIDVTVNQFGNYFVFTNMKDGENVYYLIDISSEEIVNTSNYIEARIYCGKIYYLIYNEDKKIVDLYNENYEILAEKVEKELISYNENGFSYTLDGKKIEIEYK